MLLSCIDASLPSPVPFSLKSDKKKSLQVRTFLKIKKEKQYKI